MALKWPLFFVWSSSNPMFLGPLLSLFVSPLFLLPEKGLAVQGDSTFAGGTSTMTVNARVFFNNQTRFTAPARFVDDVLFEDIVSFTDNVSFVDNVEFRQGANVTFNGLVEFVNRTSFKSPTVFNDEARFHEVRDSIFVMERF
jgi:hypothetical protein